MFTRRRKGAKLSAPGETLRPDGSGAKALKRFKKQGNPTPRKTLFAPLRLV